MSVKHISYSTKVMSLQRSVFSFNRQREKNLKSSPAEESYLISLVVVLTFVECIGHCCCWPRRCLLVNRILQKAIILKGDEKCQHHDEYTFCLKIAGRGISQDKTRQIIEYIQTMKFCLSYSQWQLYKLLRGISAAMSQRKFLSSILTKPLQNLRLSQSPCTLRQSMTVD